VKLRALLALLDRHRPPDSLPDSLGDGFLCARSPTFGAVRRAALARGFRFTPEDPGDYFAFPLVALDVVLGRRTVPYRRTTPALRALEARRPGHFGLADLKVNRPTPNYLLHEAAHGVAFEALFGSDVPRGGAAEVRAAMAAPAALVQVMLGESFAMAAEYLAACEAVGPLHLWLLSLNAYRTTAPGKAALARFAAAHGAPALAAALLVGFLHANYRRTDLPARAVDAALAWSGAPGRLTPATRAATRAALARACRMNEDFLDETARLFLGTLGHGRDLSRLLAEDPLAAAERRPEVVRAAARLAALLARPASAARRQA
jgi:hypothetical protein